MRVNICRGREVTVSQPLLDLLHWNIVGKHQACAGVPEVMEADRPETVFPQKVPEAVRNVIRLDQPADFIDADILKIVLVVGASAKFLFFFCSSCSLKSRSRTNGTSGRVRLLDFVLVVSEA